MIKFQYNKTSLQGLDKQLKMRVRALPTIKNKESALRSEVKKAKEVADEFDGKLDDTLNGISDMLQLYDEYTPDILTVKDVNMSVRLSFHQHFLFGTNQLQLSHLNY